MRAGIYCRVSSTDQIEGTSLESQKEQLEAYVRMKGFELVETFVDRGVSGGIPLAERPEGSKLTAMIENKEIQVVVITKLDRGFRSTVDCLQTVQSWEKRGLSLHIVDMGGNSVDTTSPAGRFMLTVLVAAAEMERGRIRERCNEGRKQRKREGKRIGSIPYGYSLGPDQKKLIPIPEEQKALDLLRALRKGGHSLRAMAQELNRSGIPAKHGGRWTHGQVQSVLRTLERAA